jgi:hypothetical protein
MLEGKSPEETITRNNRDHATPAGVSNSMRNAPPLELVGRRIFPKLLRLFQAPEYIVVGMSFWTLEAINWTFGLVREIISDHSSKAELSRSINSCLSVEGTVCGYLVLGCSYI